ncbi:MAG: tRNA (adenosine(37)-N6)-threonylcarbamoyltransferase complex dimerization subunit type 1 TsaB [Acidimicrobiales bacterium]
MRVLALETASLAVGVALASEDEVLAELTVRSTRRHVEVLHPAIEQVCAASGVSFDELDAVAADVGPGLFTGIRVGVSAAKAIAMALGIPAVAVTSLDAIRAGALDAGSSHTVPVVDLRRGEVAWSLGGTMAFGPPGELVEALSQSDPSEIVFAGDGAIRYSELFESHEHPAWRVAGRSLASAPVSSVAALGCLGLAGGAVLDAAQLVPCYLREADVRINWTTRHDEARGGQ